MTPGHWIVIIFLIMLATAAASAGCLGGDPVPPQDKAFYQACMQPDAAVLADLETRRAATVTAIQKQDYASIQRLNSEQASTLGDIATKLGAMPVSEKMADVKTACILSQTDEQKSAMALSEYAGAMLKGDTAGAKAAQEQAVRFHTASSLDDEITDAMYGIVYPAAGEPSDKDRNFIRISASCINVSSILYGKTYAAGNGGDWDTARMGAEKMTLTDSFCGRILSSSPVSDKNQQLKDEMLSVFSDQNLYAESMMKGVDERKKGNTASSDTYIAAAKAAMQNATQHVKTADELLLAL